MASSALRYVLPLAKLSLLAGLALSGCGGDASSTTGPTMAAPTTTAAAPAPAQTPAPAPAPAPVTRYQVRVIAQGPGCVTLASSTCASNISRMENAGTRGTTTAVPEPGRRFLGWASGSPDCPGETTNPCSFSYDRNKTITARFGS